MHDDKDVELPARLPEPGFYYHYKHDPNMVREGCPDAGIQNYAYEVLPHFGLYTEGDGPKDKFRASYIPLYPWAYVYRISRKVGRICEDHRPMSMLLENVTTDTYSGPRFRKITDSETLAKLNDIADQMYGDLPRL